MSVPVFVRMWSDAGAPQLTGRTPAEMVNVLKKVLVEGYGTSPGLGWSVAFEDEGTQKIAFRNSTATVNGVTGSGGYVQFWCPEGTNANNSRFAFRTAHGMSALDSFTKPGILENWFSTSTGTAVTHWIIIGNQFGFWLFSTLNNVSDYTKFSSGGNFAGGVFIGDMQHAYQADAGRFISMSASTGDANTSQQNPDLQSSTIVMRLYPTDGGTTSINGYVGSMTVIPDYTGAAVNNADDIAIGVNFITTPYCISPSSNSAVDSAGTSANHSLLQPAFRGILPGLVRSSFNGYRNKPFPQYRTINGKNHLLVAGNRPTSSGISTWLNIEEWY